MKKEIDVWVPEWTDHDLVEMISDKDESEEGCKYFPAKLIIDIPEPRVEVTPSMIRDAFKKCWGDAPNSAEVFNKELFGEDYEA